MRHIYSLFISLAWQFLKLLAISNKKLKQFAQGRSSNSSTSKLTNPIWIHCASVGEFEQARPLIELIKTAHPQQEVLLTFFSPSGFNHLHNYELADHVCYAPFDTAKQVKAFLNTYQPKALLLIKYEFWKNMLHYCSVNGIPVFSISSIFRGDQRFFKWYGGIFKTDLEKVTHFFVQNTDSQHLLNSIGISKVTITGDTRFDRVIDIAEKSVEVESIKNYCNAKNILIAGSTWPKDEEVLLAALDKLPSDWKLIIAPHEVNSQRITEVLEQFRNHKAVCLSGATENELIESNALIIDSIGLLNRIYRYADLCYVGGAFGAGLHNSLEAAVWGKPLVYGPNFLKYKEATDLVEIGGSMTADTIKQAAEHLLFLAADEVKRAEMSTVSREYVYRNKGASKKVISFLESERIF